VCRSLLRVDPVAIGCAVPKLCREYCVTVLLPIPETLRGRALFVRDVPISRTLLGACLTSFVEAVCPSGLLVPEFRSARKFLVAEVARATGWSDVGRFAFAPALGALGGAL
jgi:hypothetical protein